MRFATLTRQPDDPLLKIIGQHAADPRPDKIDLGVGVFRDEEGRTPVMTAVKAAEARLLETQASKSYLGPEGDTGFVQALGRIVIGDAVPSDRYVGLQTPGGTGALRLTAELLARAGVARIWIGSPSWANHAPIYRQAGVEPAMIPCYDLTSQTFDLEGFLAGLNGAAEGDAVLLHGCCHNPIGIDPDAAGWAAIAERVVAQKLIPVVDLAYQGLGDGFDSDAAGARAILAAVPEALLAYSCDKNFGLYRERTGALFAITPDADAGAVVLSNLLALARANWSMPPDHGAAIVRIILEDETLTAEWRDELETMRQRLESLRAMLAEGGRIGTVDLGAVAHGKGMFATLPLSPAQVEWLRDRHAIYMAGSGRINIAGFNVAAVGRFHDALRDMAANEVA
ncbi:aromatic amino acid transaminase [Sphingomonas pseudosanguinis]|uniref:Aromatic-amino-acid transaminase n=1 Tax=Sphingomonas pseudosanguinis TaxID=413712 RepID=A0A7W6F289_9SPHN|nr:aromatic amino acid transaminase [Sphingomonas pseudosanguinis]MBB3878548.1 aromatic-amino-acid transaminase [Sphingomonas pseudosanguinis]MBN3536198.1 aspartate/tyrosine/aromatic aminotransferase [Sphingomonas pseudosanguinis]